MTAVTRLPAGVTAALAGGVVTLQGTPTGAKAYTVQVTVADAAGATATRTYPLTVLVATTFAWTGAGGVALWSDAANWTGAAPVARATVIFPAGAGQLASVNDLPAGTRIASLVFQDRDFVVSGNAIVVTTGVTSTGNAGGTNTVALNLTLTARKTFRVAGSTSVTVTGAVGGAGGVTKSGTGTLALAAANTYTGGTTVQAGTLRADNTTGSATGTAVVTVASTATLEGTGQVGAVKVSSGGALRPAGAGATAVLHTGNLTLASGGAFAVTIGGTAAGSGYDAVAVTGTVSLGGAALQPALTFAPAVGDAFTLIDNDGADAVVGTFKGLAEGGDTGPGRRDVPDQLQGRQRQRRRPDADGLTDLDDVVTTHRPVRITGWRQERPCDPEPLGGVRRWSD